MLGIDLTLRIYKEDNKIEFIGYKGGKRTVLAIGSKYCIVKENAYSQYVNRVTGVDYQCPQVIIYECKYFKNYTKFIEVQLHPIWEQETAKDHIDSFVDLICDQVKEEQYDPLAKYSEKERKELKEIWKKQDEFMREFNKRIDNK